CRLNHGFGLGRRRGQPMYFEQNRAERNRENDEIDKKLHRAATMVASVLKRGDWQAGSERMFGAIETILSFFPYFTSYKAGEDHCSVDKCNRRREMSEDKPSRTHLHCSGSRAAVRRWALQPRPPL